MRLKQELAYARRRFDLLNFYGKFEQIVITLPALGKERKLPLRRNSHARA
jgi:hypothetical protein